MDEEVETVTMMVDLKLNKVGCVIIQAAYGCLQAHDYVMQVPNEFWEVSKTPDMKKYKLTSKQAQEYVSRLRASLITSEVLEKAAV